MIRLLSRYLKDVEKRLKRRVKVGILGLGITGRAALDTLQELGDTADITVYPLTARDTANADCVRIGRADCITDDVLIASPSVRRERLCIPEATDLISDYSLLFDSNPERLFSVSGSDGKSTTTAIASLLLSPTFPTLFTGGNLGTPLWRADLESDAFLLELSSFTLRYSLPHGGRAALTNVTPNHLDWHDSLDEYVDTKLGLIHTADEPILCLDDPVSEMAARDTRSFALVSSRLSRNDIMSIYRTEHTVTVEGGIILRDTELMLPTQTVRRNEAHNIQNLSLAIALSIGYATRERICEVAESFDGLAERCRTTERDGISYVSSSIDTTPERTATTLKSLDRRVKIILGGRGKGLSYELLSKPLTQYAERIALYGDAGREMLEWIESDSRLRTIPHAFSPKMEDAFNYVADGATAGDTVLLSPAATSYGEFRDYIERGRAFLDYVDKKHTKI